MDADALIRAAIDQRRLLELTFHDKRRIVEPHDYGIHKGVAKLLSYQVAGASSSPLPNWRWIEVNAISDVRLLDTTFAGGRGDSPGTHHRWDKVFARVKPAGSEDH